MSLSVTISRSGDDLVIYDHPSSGTYWINEDGITWPSFPMRRTYLPDSEVQGGKSMRAATLDEGQTSLTIYVHADTLANLLTAMEALEAATRQFSYTLTVTLDGSTSRSWTAKPESPAWGTLDSGEVKARMTHATITIPLNPPGSA